jgi:hypothetical protein
MEVLVIKRTQSFPWDEHKKITQEILAPLQSYWGETNFRPVADRARKYRYANYQPY